MALTTATFYCAVCDHCGEHVEEHEYGGPAWHSEPRFALEYARDADYGDGRAFIRGQLIVCQECMGAFRHSVYGGLDEHGDDSTGWVWDAIDAARRDDRGPGQAWADAMIRAWVWRFP